MLKMRLWKVFPLVTLPHRDLFLRGSPKFVQKIRQIRPKTGGVRIRFIDIANAPKMTKVEQPFGRLTRVHYVSHEEELLEALCYKVDLLP